MKLVSNDLTLSNWVSTTPRGVGAYVTTSFSPNQFFYMITEAIE
jgi:hypothetical protein